MEGVTFKILCDNVVLWFSVLFASLSGIDSRVSEAGAGIT